MVSVMCRCAISRFRVGKCEGHEAVVQDQSSLGSGVLAVENISTGKNYEMLMLSWNVFCINACRICVNGSE